MWFGRCQYEVSVVRGLLEGLQEGVERLRGEHVDLVEDVELGGELGGAVLDLLAKVADLIESAIARGVDLHDI